MHDVDDVTDDEIADVMARYQEGATFARGAYEKWKDTVDQTTARLDTMKVFPPFLSL